MATELARMRQIIGTTADWAANDIVILQGEIALEVRDDGFIWGKVGDGVSTYSTLDYSLGVNAGVDRTTDQTIEGVKTFSESIFILNQTDLTSTGQLWSADFPAGVHAVALDSKEVSSNLYLQARDSLGAAQTLACGADGRLYWNSTEIANDNGVAGVNWGGFDNLGVITRGTGFTVSTPATGQYDLTFDLDAVDNVSQSVVATCNAQLASSLTCQVQMAASNTCTIWVYDTTLGLPANSSISFIRNFIPVGSPPAVF